MLANLGCFTVGPFFESNDPKTAVTFESTALRRLILEVASEKDVRLLRHDRNALVARLRAFKTAIERGVATHPEPRRQAPIVLKHPLASLIAAELAEVFDARFVFVERDLRAIEESRERRGWPAHLGAEGAAKIFASIEAAKTSLGVEHIVVRYQDVMERPVEQARRLLTHCGLVMEDNEIESRIAVVRSHPNAKPPASDDQLAGARPASLSARGG